MPTFLQAKTAFLDYINRPSSEMATVAGREINLTLLWMQRMHKFNACERLITLTYPASTKYVDIAEACEGRPRDFISAQVLTDSNSLVGKTLKFKTFDQIIQERKDYYDKSNIDEEDSAVGDDASHASWVSRTFGYYAFLSGSRFGLYPTPTQAVTVSLNLHIWLPDLSADADENDLLTNCYDFVIMKTLQRYNVYSKQEARNPISDEEVMILWQGVKDWDNQVVNTTPQ